MAEAKKVPSEEFNVELTLTRQEAEAVLSLVGNIVGVYTTPVFNALRNCGVQGGLYKIGFDMYKNITMERKKDNGC